MAGIQWIKRGGRHRDVRKREEERVADEQIEEALAPAAKPRRKAKGGRRAPAKAKSATAPTKTKDPKALAETKGPTAAARVRLEFTAPLESVGPKGAWTGLFLTQEQSARLGTKARVPVAGSLNGFRIRSFLAPMGDGTHGMMVNKQMQVGAKAKPGESVRVILELDDAPRTVEVPPDLERALRRRPAAKVAFEGLSYTHRKDYATWVAEAKRPETRARRVEESVKLLAAGKKLKDR